MRFAESIEDVQSNAVKLHRYASGTPEERKFHRIRVSNALHHVAFEVDGETIFAPAKWSGAKRNSMEDYHANHDPVTDHFRRVLNRIGFLQISAGSAGHDRLYEKFATYCAAYGFSHSKPSKDERSFFVLTKPQASYFPDEISAEDRYFEGAKTTITVNRYERDPAARAKCIQFHGNSCVVCGFNFFEVYGELGAGFIHVHHLTPVSDRDEEYEVDPQSDLVPVCPNCHAMLHRERPPVSVKELKKLYLRAVK